MPPRLKASRLFACVLALGLAFGASSAFAQDDDDDDAGQPIVVQIDGPCALSVGGRNVACQGVAYMVFPSNGRIDFTALSGNSGWAFSGEDDDNDDGQYTLQVDSVLSPAATRVEAEGECDMEVADDKRTVRSLECRAATAQGNLTLRASGVIVAGGGDDDDDGN